MAFKLLIIAFAAIIGLQCQAQKLGSKEHVNSKHFETKLAQINQDDLKLIQTLANELSSSIGPNVLGYESYWPGYTPFLAHFRLVNERAPGAIYETLVKLANPEQVAAMSGPERESTIKSMVSNLLTKCSSYVNSLKSIIDTVSQEAEDKYEPQYGSVSLMNGWVNYEYCRQLISDSKMRDQLAEKVIAVKKD